MTQQTHVEHDLGIRNLSQKAWAHSSHKHSASVQAAGMVWCQASFTTL